MRFDDSLRTVLAADTSTALGAQAVFRQLADLIARRRAPADDVLLARLAALRSVVPIATRASVARALALSDPPAPLVAVFADDHADVSGAVLRAARLAPEEWDTLIPQLTPLGRSILRRRDDLPPSAVRALESLGTTDFALSDDRVLPQQPAAPSAPAAEEKAFRVVPPSDVATVSAPTAETGARFEIADLVSRIEEYQRDRASAAATPAAEAQIAAFRFETDAAGVIRWIDSAPRGAVIGLSLSHAGGGNASVDGVASGAYRKRAPFTDARLMVGGASALAGSWRIAGMPMFEQATGRFTGYRGSARRPRIEEEASHTRTALGGGGVGAEGLRRLVHELRTPTNAIAGFSELIENELLGPVAPAYRERAASIRGQVNGLIGAIDDLDLAARMESNALDLRPDVVALRPLLARLAGEFAPLVERRGTSLSVPDTRAVVNADAIALERLVARLLATVLSVSGPGEGVRLDVAQVGDMVELSLGRPHGLVTDGGAGLSEPDLAADDQSAPLLGIGFALRLVRNLADELGGRFTVEPLRLTVALPAAFHPQMEPATTVAP